MKKELQKKLSFVLFVMAVFFAGVALTVFSSSIAVVCIAGALLLGASVFFVMQQESKSQTASGKTSEILLADRMAELMRGNEKAEKGVYIAVKKQHEAMEEGLASLEEKISELIKSQDNAVKTLVLYNKENAKQMALSEREELGRLREELAQMNQGGTQGSSSQVVDAIKEMSRRLYEEVHETGEAVLSELESTVDSLEEMKELMKGTGGMPVAVSQDVPRMPVMTPEMEETTEDLAEELFPEADAFLPEEEVLFEEPVSLEEPEEQSEPETVEVSPISDDPNRMLSADDIAALFAAAEQEEPVAEEEPIAEEVPVKKNPEDALASSGVDLSDPNKTLSPDDIAALIAALGN